MAGLSLKAPKCILVPLCRFSPKVARDISKWLSRNIPEWKQFTIKDCTKFLGFYIGPGAGKMNWIEQATKMKERIQCIQSAKASVKLNAFTYNARVVPVVSYVAQLLNCPLEMEQTERAMMHTVLRLPQNALCHADLFHLEQLGGPKIRSVVATCASALFRTACNTISSWPDWIQQLQVAATEHLPFAQAPLMTTDCWDSPPIVLNLKEASLGFPSDERWCDGAAKAINKIQSASLRIKGEIKMQKICYEELMNNRFLNNIRSTIVRRLSDSFNPFSVDCTNSVSLDGCFATLKECKVSVAIRVLKGWVNGWATSHRYKNVERKVLPCLFGCMSCSDSLNHYLICPHLFALWSFLIEGTPDDPLIRWGLLHPSKIQFHVVACIFSGYHAVRNDLRSNPVFIPHNMTVLTSPMLRRSWSVFADSFKVEARELAVQHRRFSLPEFLIFIT